jgi:glycerol-3-phosphate dehydrogenase
MQRDIEKMSAKEYDLVVVGGGVTGSCIARDAAMRGLSVALLEMRDFASATTGASSKLIHGGLRYLQNLELGLVRESLRERRIWSNTAPHLIDPLTFIMPITGRGLKDRMMRAIGLTLYDWLAYDRNKIDDPEKSIPSHRKLSRKEALELEPGLDSEELSGAMVFHDYQMYSPERLALECVLSAAEHGAEVANYAEVDSFIIEENCVRGARVRDLAAPRKTHARGKGAHEPQPDQLHEIRGRLVVNASGPWADLLVSGLRDKPEEKHEPRHHLIRSKGIHLLTRSLTQGNAIAVQQEHRHFFILPWRGYSILGTTDIIYKGAPDTVHVSEKDIVNFLAVVNKGFPGANLVRSDVLYFYAGLRPIVDNSSFDEDETAKDPDHKQDEPDSYAASRAAEVVDHEEENGPKGLITVIGGKWTTSRSLAAKVVDMALSKLDKPFVECLTDRLPTYGGEVGRFAEFRKKALERHPDLPMEVVDNLAKNYGSRLDDVLELAKEDPHLLDRVSERFPDIAAEITYAVRTEMARAVEDVLFRRTGLGTIGTPGDAAIERIAKIMAKELTWDAEERTAQTNRALAHFTSWARTKAIVNPHSWGNRTGAIWPRIEKKLSHAIGPVDVTFTDQPMAAKRIATEALKAGMEQIIAIGGDGTINEIVNGFFENGSQINPEAALAILTSGTGRDFRRTFSMPESVDDQIDRLAASVIRPIDLGRLTFINNKGEEETRYFGNIASFGMSGEVDRAVNNLTWGKRFGGRAAFKMGVFKALARYRNKRVRIRVDDSFDREVNVCTAAVCNGQYFGSGMRIAPNASPDDGLFDVVIIENISALKLLMNVNSLYRGEHLNKKEVSVIRGAKVTVEPIDPNDEVLLDVDGEAPGRLPATFEILPAAIQFRY